MPEEAVKEEQVESPYGKKLDILLHDIEVLREKYGYNEAFILTVLSMLMNYDNQLAVEFTQ